MFKVGDVVTGDLSSNYLSHLKGKKLVITKIEPRDTKPGTYWIYLDYSVAGYNSEYFKLDIPLSGFEKELHDINTMGYKEQL